MERAKKIIRRAIFTFLKNFQHFTSGTPILLLLLPFSVSSLFVQALLLHSLCPLDLDLPSSIFLLASCFSSSVFFLVKSKSSILQVLNPPEPFSSSFVSWHRRPLLEIQSSNLLLVCLFSASYGSIKSLVPFHVSILFGTIYYMICTNVTVVFNLAFVISKTRRLSAYAAIQEAFSMRVQDSTTTVFLALASSSGSAAIEALFRYRIVRAPSDSGKPLLSRSIEGLLVAHLYSIVIVLDTIACFLAVRGCGGEPKPNSASNKTEGCSTDTNTAVRDVEDFSSRAEVHINL